MRQHFLNSFLICAFQFALLGCGGDSNGSNASDPSAPLNDTGVATCHSLSESGACPAVEALGQDGEYGRDHLAAMGLLEKSGAGLSGFDFTKLDANGLAIKVQAEAWSEQGDELVGSRWSCVRDNVTNKIWEVKSQKMDAYNYHGHRYTWFSDSAGNGGSSGELGENPAIVYSAACMGLIRCDTQAYLNLINRIGLCGKNNWRLPSVTELLSIADQSLVNPPLDTAFFPNTNLNAHWSNQTLASDASLAWYVYFTAAGNGQIAKSSLAHIRAVSNDE